MASQVYDHFKFASTGDYPIKEWKVTDFDHSLLGNPIIPASDEGKK